MKRNVSNSGDRMGRRARVLVFLMGLLALCGCGQAPAEVQEASVWQANYDAALKQAETMNQYVVVSISGLEWCGWCKVLEKEVFSQPEFMEYAKKNLVCVLLDFDRSGRATNAEFAQQHEALLQQFKVEGFPTVLIMNPQGKLIKRDGYQRGGAQKYVEWIQGVIATDQK